MTSCKHLEMIVELELEKGNAIEKVEQGKWTGINKVVIFSSEISSREFSETDGIDYWENRDTHYPVQNGYVCKKCSCALAFPMKI